MSDHQQPSPANLIMVAEAVQYDPFYRRHGVFQREKLSLPKISTTLDIEMPISPVIHYLPDDSGQVGPDQTWWMIRRAPGEVYVEHVKEIDRTLGKTRRLPGDFMSAARKYHHQNPELKLLLNRGTALANQMSTIVINYALAPKFYQYQKALLLEWQKNMNFRNTVWNNVTEMVKVYDRHHWIPLQMPDRFPILSQITRAEKKMDRESIRRFTTLPSIFFLDVWKWFGEHREESPIANIPADKLHLVNLVFMVRSEWYTVNLGKVEAYRQQNPDDKTAPFTPFQMQKRFLRGLMSLVEASVGSMQTIDALGDDVKKDEGDEENSAIQDPGQRLDSQSAQSRSNPSLDLPSSSLAPLENTLVTTVGSKDFQTSTAASKRSEHQSKSREELADVIDEAAALLSEKTDLTDEELDRDLENLDLVDTIQQAPPLQSFVNPNSDPMVSGIAERAEALVKAGLISSPELNRLNKMATAYKDIPSPFGKGTLAEFAVITEEELKLDNEPFQTPVPTPDASFLRSSLNEMTSKYVKNTLHKDIVNCILSAQRGGVAITDLQRHESHTVSGSSEIYTVRLNPVGGVPTTWRFTVPAIKEDGTFKSGGTRYRARWQRRDKPIRKTGPRRVTLTSYFGKVAINLSDRAIHNYTRWLTNAVSAAGMEENGRIKDVVMTNVFDQSIVVPKIYSTLSRRIKTMRLDDLVLFFDYAEREKLFSEPELDRLEKDGAVVAGQAPNGAVVVIQKDSTFTLVNPKDKSVKVLGQFEDIVGLDRRKAPIETAMIKVRNQQIPLGVALGFYMGLDNLLKLTNATHRRVLAGDRLELQPHEIPIRFSDETLVISSREPLVSMLVGGFRFYHAAIREMSIYNFDKVGADQGGGASYVALLDPNARSTKHTNELRLMHDMFVDPITEELLQSMKEPTRWIPLLIRAADLLMQDYSPDEVDNAEMVWKGYERLPGTIYKELVQGMRQHMHRNRISKSGIDIKPTAVWNTFTGDAAISIVDDSNPIAELRTMEAVTYIGNGGRSKRSMVAATRRFHKNGMGLDSEATVDSGDVGINTYLTANPRFLNTRGMPVIGPIDTKQEISSLVSTTALLSSCIDSDDPKRANFASIQHGSGIAAVGYQVPPYQTGYGDVLQFRTSKSFTFVAQQNGSVVSIRDGVIKVKYEDGTVEGCKVGRIFTSGAGHKYPHDMKLTVKAGETFVKGDCLAYNGSFFKPNYFFPRNVQYKAGVLAWVALLEATSTHEDSSAITESLSAQLKAYETETRDIVLNFDAVVHNLVKEGDTVAADSILCTLEDTTSEGAGLFSEKSLSSLSNLANNAPKAKVAGVVDEIEILYNGDVEDMSESLQKLVVENDNRVAKRNRDLGEEFTTGRTDESQRIDNNPLQLDTLVIRISISHGREAFAGDKGTYVHQMKSVFGLVLTGTNRTKSGQKIDALFSDASNENRLVRSSRRFSMYNTTLSHITNNVVAAYRGK